MSEGQEPGAAPGAQERATTGPSHSIVVPLFNEEENLAELKRRLVLVMDGTPDDWEIVLVDDGSRDKTLAGLREIHDADPRFKVLSFSRNFGHQAAVSAGLAASSGRTVSVIDADLQDPPELITDFLRLWREGHDVVYGVRRRRKEGLFYRVAYSVFYRLMARLSHVPIPRDAGDFCLMDRRVVDEIVAMPETRRYMRGLRAFVGFRQVGLEYDRPARAAGTSKYSLRSLFGLAAEGLFSFSFLPLRLASWAGLAFSLLSFLAGMWALVKRLFFDPKAPGWASTMLLVAFVGGIQLLCLGVLGEYMARVLSEVKRRPEYVIAETFGLDPPPRGSRRRVE